MIITAKYASVCPSCEKKIKIGSRVKWERGEKATHAGCERIVVASGPSPVATREPMGAGHGRAANVAGYASYCTDNASCSCYDCAG